MLFSNLNGLHYFLPNSSYIVFPLIRAAPLGIHTEKSAAPLNVTLIRIVTTFY